MTKISDRQHAILEFIRKEVKDRGYPPSVREIGEAVGLASSSTVHGHLERLERKGLIRRDPSKPRAIEILAEDELADFSHTISRVPLIGKVTAGTPITAVENIEEYFPLPEHFVKDDEVFMLSVVGDSMIEVGIYDRDYVIVRKQPDAKNGEIVVAMTEDDEATVKTFYKEKGYVRLQPENSALQPQIYPTVTILGKVIGIFRSIQ